MSILNLFLHLVLVTIIGLLYMGVSRKITAYVQNRYGPPVYQPILDVLKLFGKKGTVSRRVIHSPGPVIAWTGISTALLFLPLGNHTPLLHFNGDLFVVLYLLLVSLFGMALEAGESADSSVTIRTTGALSMMLTYEVIFFMAILPVFYHYNTASIYRVIQAQGAFPNWAAIRFFISFIAGLFALRGLLGEKPFELIVAPHGIVSGSVVEHGGKYPGLLQLCHAVGTIVKTGLFVDIFFGPQNILWFFVGTFLVFSGTILVNAIMPRFKIEQSIRFYCFFPLLLATLGILQVYIWR